MTRYADLPQPHEISTREKEDAMGAYLMMFASIGAGLPLPIINLIAAVIYYFINRSKSLFVHFHSLQSLLSQTPTTLMNAAAVIWLAQIFIFQNWEWNEYLSGYLGLTVFVNVCYFIFSIIAAVKARNGRMYYFFFFGKLSYHVVFKLHEGKPDAVQVNKPPA